MRVSPSDEVRIVDVEAGSDTAPALEVTPSDGVDISGTLRVAFDGRSLRSPVLRGWDRYAVGLVRALVELGVDVTLFHRAREPLHPPHVEGLGCRLVGLADASGIYWEQVALPLALRRGRYDLYHAPFERGVPLASPCPVALTIHSLTEYSYADKVRRGVLPGPVRSYLGYDIGGIDLNRFYHRFQLVRADHVITPSEYCRAEVIRFLGLPPDRVSSTPLGIHEQFLRPARPERERIEALGRLGVRQPYLMFVGGYEAHKNLEGLLRMFARVKVDHPGLAIVLVGSKAVPDDLPRFAEGLGLRPGLDVVFLSDIGDELTDLYDGARLVVTLSWRETFCLPLVEAMARGIPVVASAWGASPEVVGDVGRLVDPRDPDAAASAILQLLAQDVTSSEQVERLQAQALRFDWKTTATQTLRIYRELLERGR